MSSNGAATLGAAARLRPVLMTSIAMIAGMVPVALGLSEGGDRTAPLGRAVIGGFLASTCAVLLVLPEIYALFVPSSAVATILRGTFVVLIDNDKTRQFIVAKGQSMDSKVEIVGKIHPGDTVALKATDEYKDPTTVTAKLATAEDVQKAMKQAGGGGD